MELGQLGQLVESAREPLLSAYAALQPTLGEAFAQAQTRLEPLRGTVMSAQVGVALNGAHQVGWVFGWGVKIFGEFGV